MEDPANTARYASNILINNLSKDFYRTFLQKINGVSVEDIKKVSQKYFEKDKSRIVMVGNASKIIPNLARLGYPIKKYDKYAEPVVDKPKETEVKESSKTTDAISAYSVIESYLKAIGGKEEVKKVTSIKTSLTMAIGGMQLEANEKKMAPSKVYTEIKMGENKVMQQSFDGTKGYQVQRGQKKDMDEKEIKEAQDEKGVIPQLYYITNDFVTTYLGTGKVGDEECYKLKITKPSSKVSIEYYSTKTGLLLKEESTSEDGEESTTYSNYQKVGNLMFPFTIVQMQGEQEFNLTVKEIKVNEGVTEEDFK